MEVVIIQHIMSDFLSQQKLLPRQGLLLQRRIKVFDTIRTLNICKYYHKPLLNNTTSRYNTNTYIINRKLIYISLH